MGISMALSLAMVLAFSTFANAGDETVSASQDNITVTKSAQWVKVNDKSADENGNPYAKITFKVDTTKASTTITNTVSKGGSTDIMLVVDNSESMLSNNKMTLAKQAAVEFTKELMQLNSQSVRIGLVTFNTEGRIDLDLNSYDQHVIDKINLIKANGGTNIQKGVYLAQTILKGSQAKNKMMIVLSDGYPNGKMKATEAGPEVAVGNTDAERAINQATMATAGANGNKMFYKADVKASQIVQDLAGVFEQITETVTSYVIGNSLVDTIPAEFNIVEGTVTVNDEKIKATLSEDKKTITWSWGENKLENKVYEMSVVTTLDKSKFTTYDFANGKKVYTNGTTIDVNKDSTGSAIFGYGKKGVIKLTSPKLALSNSILSNEETKKVEEDKKTDANKEQDKTVTEETKTATGNDLDESPKTADEYEVMAYILVVACGLVLMVGSGLALNKKRNR